MKDAALVIVNPIEAFEHSRQVDYLAYLRGFPLSPLIE